MCVYRGGWSFQLIKKKEKGLEDEEGKRQKEKEKKEQNTKR